MFKQIIILFIFSVFLFSCKTDKTPDVSHIKVNLEPVRYDKLLSSIDTNNVKDGFLKLSQQHPFFTEVFTQHLTGWGALSDTSTIVFNGLRHFLTYKDYVNLQKTVNQKFVDTKDLDEKLTQLFQFIKYYFPKYKVPKLYYFNSGLNNYSAITYDTLVGVGLDMHLGKDFEFYPSIQLPDYQIVHCTPDFITPNMASTVYKEIIPFDIDGKSLLHLMLQKGKEMYYLDHVLPKANDELKIGFSKTQYEWCEKNQAMIWNLFVQQKLLYETNLQKIMPYVLDGPNSQGLPLECPGNVGTFIGWQIIKKYVDKNGIKNLEEFCRSPIDAQKILLESGYRPRY